MTPVLGILAALLTFACAAVLVRMYLLPTDYGVDEYRRYYRWHTAALGYAALVLAAAIARTTHPVPELIIFLLMTFAAARLLIPSFPTDLDRSRPTSTGRLHIALASVAFASIAWCAAALPNRVDWPSLHTTLIVLGWAVAGSAIACGLCLTSPLRGRTEPYFGAIERVFYVAVLVWFVVVSVHFI